MFSVYPMVKQYPATDKLDKYNIARYSAALRQVIAQETFMGKLCVRAIVSHRIIRGDSFYGLSFEFASGSDTVAVGTRFYSSKRKVNALQEIAKNPPTLSEIMERTDFSHLSEGFKLAIFNPLRLEVNDLVESIRQDKELYKHLKWLDGRYPNVRPEPKFNQYVNTTITPPDKLNVRGMNFEGVYPIMKAILYRQLILISRTFVKERRGILYHRAALWSMYIMDYNNTDYYLNDLQRTRRNVMLLKLLTRNIFYYAELVKGLSRYRTLDINDYILLTKSVQGLPDIDLTVIEEEERNIAELCNTSPIVQDDLVNSSSIVSNTVINDLVDRGLIAPKEGLNHYYHDFQVTDDVLTVTLKIKLK